MKLQHIIISFVLLFSYGNLFGQTNQTQRMFLPFLDAACQRNVVVTVSDLFGDGQPCPLEYTNLISNTNFFTPEQQKLLVEIPLKYKNVTTNSGPPRTVLVSLVKTNYVIPIVNKTNEEWVADFQYTNSQAQDKVSFFAPHMVSVDFQTKSGDEYILNLRGDSILAFGQIKQGIVNGFSVEFNNNRLSSYRYFTNGMEIGKYFEWNPQNGNLVMEADFKEPCDIEKHRVNPFQQ